MDLVIFPERCTGCKICEEVCSLNLRISKNNRKKNKESSRPRIRIIKRQLKSIIIPIVCSQCEQPLCVKVCPTEALSKNSKEIVTLDELNCIGCKLCTYVCPIEGIFYDTAIDKVVKCEECNGDPVCVKYCPSEAIKYLDASKASDRIKRAKTENILKLIAPDIYGKK